MKRAISLFFTLIVSGYLLFLNIFHPKMKIIDITPIVINFNICIFSVFHPYKEKNSLDLSNS